MENILKKERCIKEMEQIIRRKTEACQTCTWYLNGVCDDSCELAEDNHKICADLYDADYRKQEWISVESGLPEDGDYITLTNATGKNKGVIPQKLVTTTVRGKTVRRWEWNYRISPWTVTHYMPLPEPPETKGETE